MSQPSQSRMPPETSWLEPRITNPCLCDNCVRERCAIRWTRTVHMRAWIASGCRVRESKPGVFVLEGCMAALGGGGT